MHLFIEGERRIGKSTMLQAVLAPWVQKLCGFSVQRLTENGAPVGYCVQLLRDAFPPVEAPYEPDSPGLFIDHGKNDRLVLDTCLHNVVQLSKSPLYSGIFLDEIGGFELLSPSFMDTLIDLLEGEKPCIGVLKAFDNLKVKAEKSGRASEYRERHAALMSVLENRGRLLTMTPDNRAEIRSEVQKYAAEAFGSPRAV